jgi:glycosyltransferase involved in cell wall biosynthesis
VIVSVIIPCYNVENYISECLDSILAQTYPSIEIICVDNNSTDNTVETIKKYSSKHSNITLLHEPMKGAPSARNKGLFASKGEWIQFLDADDILLPSKIETQLSLTNQNIGFICGSYIRKRVSGEELKVFADDAVDNKFFSLVSNKLGITSSNLFKKNHLIELGGWNPSLKSSQETDLMFRLIKNHVDFCVDANFLTIVRDRPSGRISQRNPIEKWKTFIDVRLPILKYVIESENILNEDYTKLYSYLYSTILILNKHAHNLAASSLEELRKIKRVGKIIPIAGIDNKKAKLINLLGQKLFLKLQNYLTK